MCGGRGIPRADGFVALVRSVLDSRRPTRLRGIGFVDLGSCPLEGGHSDVSIWVQGAPTLTSTLSIRNAATLRLLPHQRRHRDPETLAGPTKPQ